MGRNINAEQGFIKSKYMIPEIFQKVADRERISYKLNDATRRKLAIVTAPYGYGKTTAVQNWLRKNGLPAAWISLEVNDNDPVSFWRYILTAFKSNDLLEESSSSLDLLINRELICSNIFLDAFIDTIDNTNEKAFLVLDDLDRIEDKLIFKSLRYFLLNKPDNLIIIIISQKEIDSGITGMHHKDQILRVNTRELLFNSEETDQFFKNKGIILTQGELTDIESCTGGWAAGLTAVALALREGVHITEAVGSKGSRHHLDKYLDEVFDCWTDEIKRFLLKTAHLKRLNGVLCSYVTGDERSGEYLKNLSEHNSFIIPQDKELTWFCYHPLFQEYLIHRLDAERIPSKRALCQSAGEWYLEKGYIPYAINYFIEAKEYTKALPLIRDTYCSITQNGEFATWIKWMESIPKNLIERDTRACVEYSWVLYMGERPDNAELFLEKAKEVFSQLKVSLDREEKDYLEADILIACINSAIYRMDSAKVYEYYKSIGKFRTYFPVDIGEINSGEVNLLNTVYGFKGRLNRVRDLYGRVIKEMTGTYGNLTGYVAVILAEAEYERGNLKSVYTILVKNLKSINELNNHKLIVPCIIALANKKKAEGDLGGALHIIEAGKRMLDAKNKSTWNYFFNICIADLYLSSGDWEKASELFNMDRISILDDFSSSREYEYIVYAKYLMVSGFLDEALILLSRLEDFSRKENRLHSLIRILCLIGINCNQQGDLKNAMITLHKALELGSKEGYLRTFVDEAQPMANLLIKYKSWANQTGENKYVEYAKGLLLHTEEFARTLKNTAFKGNIL